MNARIETAPDLLAKARYLYERTITPVDDIAAMLGMSKTPFYKRVQAGGWSPRRVRSATGEFARVLIDGVLTPGNVAVLQAPPPAADAATMPQAGLPLANATDAEPLDRVTLAARLLATVERHVAAIARLQDVMPPATPAEAERHARTLVVMGRAMREAHILLKPPQDNPSDDPDDDRVPIDADEFRRELAEKLESLLDAERRSACEDHRGIEPKAG